MTLEARVRAFYEGESLSRSELEIIRSAARVPARRRWARRVALAAAVACAATLWLVTTRNPLVLEPTPAVPQATKEAAPAPDSARAESNRGDPELVAIVPRTAAAPDEAAPAAREVVKAEVGMSLQPDVRPAGVHATDADAPGAGTEETQSEEDVFERLPDPELSGASAEDLYRDGLSLLSREWYPAAVRFFSACVRRDPEFGLCYRALGITYAKVRDAPKAYRWYEAYFEHFPQARDAGQVADMLRQYEEHRRQE
jgi:hypothetical protein